LSLHMLNQKYRGSWVEMAGIKSLRVIMTTTVTSRRISWARRR